MDNYVVSLFHESNGPIHYLESSSEIYGAFFHPSISGVKDVFEGAVNMLDHDDFNKSLIGSFGEDDQKDFEAQKADPRNVDLMGEDDDFVDVWLGKAWQIRNAAWEKRLLEYLNDMPREASCLVCVGINHLPDESGVFKMLERYGITDTGIEQFYSDGSWRRI